MQSLEEAFRSGLDTTRHWLIEAIHLLPLPLVALIVLLLSIWIGNVLRRRLRKPLERALRRSHSGMAMVTLAGQAIFIFCVGLGLLIDASILGLDKVFASLLASAGVFGLAIGYAFKGVAANFFAGVVISLRQPMKTDDLADVGGHFGRVVEIDLLYTTLETLDGQIVYVPNQTAYDQPIVNYSKSGARRVVLRTGVSYGDDLETVRQLALSTIKGFDFLMPDKPIDLYFTEIGGSSYNFILRYWIRFDCQSQYREALSTGIMHLKKAFDAQGISIPYPVQTLDFGVKGGVNLFDQPVAVETQA